MNRQTHSAQYVVIQTWTSPRMTMGDFQRIIFAHVAAPNLVMTMPAKLMPSFAKTG
ncbi:hypothetical protein FHX09_004688 [Rhizobium sp. BK538]|nr:hypothetical protein [Rhizobium sp. BK538]